MLLDTDRRLAGQFSLAFGSPLRAAYELRQRAPDFVLLAKTAVRLALDA